MIQLKTREVQYLRTIDHPLADRLELEVTNAQIMLEAGTAEDALNKLERLWAELPEPKVSWDLYSGWISETIFRCYMSLARYGNAKEWALIHLDCRTSDYDTRPLVYVGMASLELGQAGEAYEYFDVVYGIGKRRAFKGEAPKYLEFYRTAKK